MPQDRHLNAAISELLYPHDVMNQNDSVSLEELQDAECNEGYTDELSRSGISEGTPTDVFITAQGDSTYVTAI